jgi:hypothetical protein
LADINHFKAIGAVTGANGKPKSKRISQVLTLEVSLAY